MKKSPARAAGRAGTAEQHVHLSARASAAQGKRLAVVAKRFMRAMVPGTCELSLSLVGDAAIRVLNRDWRGKDTATDVLSFPAGDSPDVGLRPLGDIVISLQTARRAAKEHGVALDDELDRYLAHGLLHLLGYDHHRKADAAHMARAETKLLGAAGMLGS